MTCERRHVLVTGTSSGIGRATMAAAQAQGWHVFAGERRPEPAADHGEWVTHVRLDVTDQSDIAATADTIAAHVGPRGLDGLANIAGIGIPGPLEIMPMADLRRSLEVDFFGQVALTQAMLDLIRTAQGRIVFIGSIVDRITVPYFGALAAAKSAIAAVSDTFRQELAPWGIKVALVEPGFISTGADATTKAMIDRRIESMTPDQAALYGKSFADATAAGYKTQTSGSRPEGVADVIMKALSEPHPHTHYLTGSKSHLMAALAHLPQPVQDEIKRKAFDQPGPGSLA
ncbi:MAG: SDR family NAD(P)-dependent oxidoreductase [Actinobacteria bacterium]|nr:SDR family NAD(P)-dependent oxidoreductase [Actinomycetota bacterium]